LYAIDPEGEFVVIPDGNGGIQRFYIKDVPQCVHEWCVQTGELQGDFYIFMVRVRTDIPRDLAGMLNEKIHKAKQTVRVAPGQQKFHMPSLGEKRHGTIITKAQVSNDVLINLELLDKTRVSLKQAHLQMWVQVKRTTLLLLEDSSDNALLDYVKSLVKNFSYMAEFVNRRIYFERIDGVNWEEIENFRRQRQIDMQEEARKGHSKGLGKGKGKAKGKPEDVPTHAEYQSDDDRFFTAGRSTSFIQMCKYYLRDSREGRNNKGCEFYDTCTFLHSHALNDIDCRGADYPARAQEENRRNKGARKGYKGSGKGSDADDEDFGFGGSSGIVGGTDIRPRLGGDRPAAVLRAKTQEPGGSSSRAPPVGSAAVRGSLSQKRTVVLPPVGGNSVGAYRDTRQFDQEDCS
jgi:hypothetical protein